jgi:hypothetical protein
MAARSVRNHAPPVARRQHHPGRVGHHAAGYIEIDTLFTTARRRRWRSPSKVRATSSRRRSCRAPVLDDRPQVDHPRRHRRHVGQDDRDARSIVATIAVGTVTAGKGRVVLTYI